MADINAIDDIETVDTLDADLEAMRRAELEPEQDAPEADQEPQEAAPEQEFEQEREPLSADEWKRRHDNLQKALHAERSKRKEGDEYKAKFAEIEARIAALTPAQRAEAKEEAEQRPDANTDPLAALDYAIKKITEYETLEQQRTREAQEREQQRQQVAQFTGYVNEHEETFSRAAPDYYDAVQWLRERRAEHFTALGYDAESAKAQAVQEAQQLAVFAYRSQKSPAEMAYNYAKAMGYAGSAQEPAANSYQKVKQGQRASKTLSGGGAGPKVDISIESLINSDDDPLDALHKGAESEFDRQFAAYARTARRL